MEYSVKAEHWEPQNAAFRAILFGIASIMAATAVTGCFRPTEQPITSELSAVSAAVTGSGTESTVKDQRGEETQLALADDDDPTKGGDAKSEETKARSPFPRRIDIPEFPKDAPWLNTGGPIRKQDLRGKFVILDFWTYCCINCMHILPELKKLEREFPNELVVIGVHSAKFENEKDRKNIEEAIERYEIEHPVVNDSDHEVWETFGVNSWPTVLLVDPEGYAVWGRSGEIRFEEVEPILKAGIEYYREKGSLDSTPLRFELLAERAKPTPLRFPGKVLADEKNQRLFIADSNHNRIVVAGFDGKLMATIGSGAQGHKDGKFDSATFDHPQGMVLNGETLYIADTESHMLRKANLKDRTVTTISGTGNQSRNTWPGLEGVTRAEQLPDRFVGKPKVTALNSPWDLWIHKNDLYIAMAGPHQIWKMPLDESEIGPYAGNGREDIVDGPLLPPAPYQGGFASFAQPSGLTSDGEWLYVADSEGSSIRAVPFEGNEEVRTVVGTSHLRGNRLFTFGDVDGERERVLLQHALGVAYHDGKIYVADTYNNKVKEVDAKTGATKTIAGTGQPGNADAPAEFDEPAGIAFAGEYLFVADTNNHAVRKIHLADGRVESFVVTGLQAPKPVAAKKPNFSKADQVQIEAITVKPVDGKLKLAVDVELPDEWKINEQSSADFWIESASEKGVIERSALGSRSVSAPKNKMVLELPVAGKGEETITVSARINYCRSGGEGLCKIGSVVWTIPIKVSDSAKVTEVPLKHRIDVK